MNNYRFVDEYAFEKPGHYVNYIKDLLKSIKSELRDLKNKLPRHVEDLDEDTINVVKVKPLPQLRKVREHTLVRYCFTTATD